MKKDEVIVVLNSSRFGQGNPQLGEKLMKLFFAQLEKTQQTPAAILLYNTAVILACQDSPVQEAMEALVKAGVDVLVNEESLEFYSLGTQLKAGHSTPLAEMTERMLSAQTLIKP